MGLSGEESELRRRFDFGRVSGSAKFHRWWPIVSVDSEGRSEAIEGTCVVDVPEGRGDRSEDKLSDIGESGSSLAHADHHGSVSAVISASRKQKNHGEK